MRLSLAQRSRVIPSRESRNTPSRFLLIHKPEISVGSNEPLVHPGFGWQQTLPLFMIIAVIGLIM